MEKDSIPHITCEHLQKIKSEPEGNMHLVVDLRDPLEYDAGHIEGSKNIPRRELVSNIQSVVPDKTHRVIVVVGPTLESEIQSIHEDLTGLGYSQVEFLSGGFDRWCEISMPSVDDVLDDTGSEEVGSSSVEDEDPYEGEDLEEENEPLM
ncbi:MAG: rhodanese-like domain-containing protein [bacterium]